MRFGNLGVIVMAAVLVACGGAEARKNGYMTRGREYLAAQNFEKARLEFRNALQLDPNDAEAAYLAGRATERTGNVREAAGLYQDAIQSNEHHLGARAALARLYVFAGAPQKAIDLLQPALAEAPNDPDLLVARAAARQRLEDSPGALADAQAALKAAPADENAITLLASIYSQSGDTAHAIEVLGRAAAAPTASADLRAVLAQLYLKAGKRREAMQQLARVIALDPKSYVYRFQLAQMQLLDQNVAAAESTLRAAVRDLPKNAEAELALVGFLEQHRPANAAEAELQRVIAVHPGDYRYRLRLGEFYARHAQLANAERIDRQIMKDDEEGPSGLAARNQLARAYLANGQPTLALPLVSDVLKRNPRDNDALTTRAQISLLRGEADAAIADLRAVLQDQPGSASAQRALAHAYLRNNDPTLAEETLRAAAQRDPKNADIQLDLAQLLARSGRLDQAEPMLEKLHAVEPENLTALEALFDVHIARKDLPAARALAHSVQSSLPKLPIGFFMTGTVELRDHHLDAARTAFERAAALAPQSIEPVTALVRLDLAEGHSEAALDRIALAREANPKDARLVNLQGEVLAGIKRGDEAIAAWRAAIALSPALTSPYRNIATLQYAHGEQAAALATLASGVAATNNAPELVVERASLEEKLGHADAAIAQYEQLLARGTDSSVIPNNLAMLLVTYRNDPQSLERAHTLAQRFAGSQDPALMDTWGWVLYKRGDTETARGVLQKVVDKTPQLAVARYHLALAELKTGGREQARLNLDKAIRSGIEFNGLDDARRTLQSLNSEAAQR